MSLAKLLRCPTDVTDSLCYERDGTHHDRRPKMSDTCNLPGCGEHLHRQDEYFEDDMRNPNKILHRYCCRLHAKVHSAYLRIIDSDEDVVGWMQAQIRYEISTMGVCHIAEEYAIPISFVFDPEVTNMTCRLTEEENQRCVVRQHSHDVWNSAAAFISYRLKKIEVANCSPVLYCKYCLLSDLCDLQSDGQFYPA